jgi:hypothetical protein
MSDLQERRYTFLVFSMIVEFYSYADITLISLFPMADLLATINKREKQSSDITFDLMGSPLSELGACTDWIHHWHTTSGNISISLARLEKDFLLRFPSLADFVVSNDGSHISAWPATGNDEETLRHLLLDQVMPRLLSHQGHLVLHASAINVNGRAIAFVGETGRGKSTLAASFHLSGYPLLTDDGLLIKEEGNNIKALPCYPGLRLWRESFAALFNESPPQKAMASYSSKNRVRLHQNNKNEPVELAALFVLEKSAVEADTAAIRVSPLSARDACMELVRNSFQLDVSNYKQVTSLFAAASSVAEHLPVFSLTYPRDFSILPALHEAVLEQQNNPVIASV